MRKDELINSLEQALEAARQLPEEKQGPEWPKDGDKYWFYGSHFNIWRDCYYSDQRTHRNRLRTGNCFRTEEEATQARDDHLNWLDFCEKADGEENKICYVLTLTTRDGILKAGGYTTTGIIPLPGFSSILSLREAAKGMEASLERHMKRMRKGI